MADDNLSWFERSFRRVLVDMHVEEWHDDFLSQLDPEEYVRMLQVAGVQSTYIYANSHVGYCYWPTSAGHMHRAIRGRDILGEMISLCAAHGIDGLVYYSLIFNNWAYETHPEWRVIDRHGRGSREAGADLTMSVHTNGRYGTVCPNSGYREFALAQVAELCQGYDCQGFFFDDAFFWPAVCYCDHCQDRFRRESGRKGPLPRNSRDPDWSAFRETRLRWLAGFVEEIAVLVRTLSPQATVTFNCGLSPISPTLSEVSDYTGGDFGGGLEMQSFLAKLHHHLTGGQPFELMGFRCDPNIFEHTTTKDTECLRAQTYLTMAHGGCFTFIDAMDPVGTLDAEVYRTIGQIYEETQAYEPHLGGKACEDIGVYFSFDADTAPSDVESEPGGASPTSHLAAVLGACNAFRRRHIPHGVITRRSLGLLPEYRALVLPNVQALGADETDAIEQYVAGGGHLYASGFLPRGFLKRLAGVTCDGFIRRTSYLTPTACNSETLRGLLLDRPLCVAGGQVRATAESSSEVIAIVVLPYTDPEDGSRFASIHANPPGIPTSNPAVVRRSFGDGTVIWAAALLEADGRGPQTDLFVRLVVSALGGHPSFRAVAPQSVEVRVTNQPERGRFIISLVNLATDSPALVVPPGDVEVRLTGRAATQAIVVPSGLSIPFEVHDGYARIRFEAFERFRMMGLSYEPA